MYILSLEYFNDLTHFFRILWRIKCNLFIHWKSMLYCVIFEVINNGFSLIISCTCGGFTVHHCHTGRHPFYFPHNFFLTLLSFWCCFTLI